MKKNCFRVFAVLFVCILTLGCFVTTAAAASQTTDLFTLDSPRNMGITVTYDVEPPAIEFIAPNGDVYGSQAVADGKMTKTDSGTALFFRIPNAQAGTWKIMYDKKSNTDVEVGYAPYAVSLKVEQFTFAKTNDDTLNVKFLTSHSTGIYYSYKIYAVLTENGAVIGQKELCNGGAYANEQTEVDVNIGNLSSYSSYQLMLEVTANENGIDLFDSMVSTATFAYTDPNANEAPENFYVETDVTSGSLRINWENTLARGRETLVAVYTNNAAEPIYHNSFTSDVNVTEIALDLETITKIRVELSYKNYIGQSSKVASRTIDMAVAKAVSLNCEDITSAAQTEIVYKLGNLTGGPFKAILTVNDATQVLSLQGDSSFSVKLENFNNEVYLVWYYNEFTAFKIGKEIYSDRLAPMLNIPDVTGTVKTGASTYILAGTVDAGCTVTVNAAPIEVDANGIFTTKLSLVVGENIFTVVATGPNGNSIQQTVVVEWVEPGAIESTSLFAVVIRFLPLIICAVLAIVLSLFALSSRKKYRKLKEYSSKRAAAFTVASNFTLLMVVISAITAAAFVVLLVLSIMKVNSIEFYNTAASAGVIKAYELIRTRNTHIIGTVISIICTAAFIALSVLFGKQAKKPVKETIKKPKKEKAPKAPKPATPVTPSAPPTPPVKEPEDVKPDANTPAPSGSFCSACGTKNVPGTKFCKTCGKPIGKKD